MIDANVPSISRPAATDDNAKWAARQLLAARRNSFASLRADEFKEEQARAFLEAEGARLAARTVTPVRRGYVPRFAKK